MSEKSLFSFNIFWSPLFKFGSNLFIKQLLNIRLFYELNEGVISVLKNIKIVNLKKFFIFRICIIYHYYAPVTGIQIFENTKKGFGIGLFIFGLEYQCLLTFPFLRRKRVVTC